jgi:dethiobiotin synthetase
MHKTIFVSGIGTDVGKTVASAILCRALNAAYWKPIQSGTNVGSDKDTIRELAGAEVQIFNEVYSLKEPLSPHTAAELENIEIELNRIQIPEHNSTLIIEGAGGLMVPITRDYLYSDWLKELQVPCILVSRHYLGSINHTLLSLSLMRELSIPILGVLFVGKDNNNNETLICERFGVQNLGNISETDNVNSAFVLKEAKKLSQYWNLNKIIF